MYSTNVTEPKVTSIEELKKYQAGEAVELPPFANNQPFVARLRRPSMLALAKNGAIPNDLLTSANSLFEKGGQSFDALDEAMLTKMFDVMEVICEASFVEPSYKAIKEAGIELTDEQYMFVFGYSQNGIKQLNSFR